MVALSSKHYFKDRYTDNVQSIIIYAWFLGMILSTTLAKRLRVNLQQCLKSV